MFEVVNKTRETHYKVWALEAQECRITSTSKEFLETKELLKVLSTTLSWLYKEEKNGTNLNKSILPLQEYFDSVKAKLYRSNQTRFHLIHVPTNTSFVFIIHNHENSELKFNLRSARANILQEIRQKRLDRKQKALTRHIFRGREPYQTQRYSLCGGVHTEKNCISWLMESKSVHEMQQGKSPANAEKHIGIELEFFSKDDTNALIKKLFYAGLKQYVTVKHDGSIRSETERPHCHEVCLLAKETEINSVVQKVCAVLKSGSAKVNRTCGMHVHIDMRSRNRDITFANLVSCQPILYSMNPKSRLESINGQRFCQISRSRRLNTNAPRYRGINGAALRRHGTIEVRIHAGTIDATKINNWVSLLLQIVNKETRIGRYPTSFKGFVRTFNISEPLAEYIVNRIKTFSQPDVQEEAA